MSVYGARGIDTYLLTHKRDACGSAGVEARLYFAVIARWNDEAIARMQYSRLPRYARNDKNPSRHLTNPADAISLNKKLS
jgi:hypothetical protein